MRAITAGLVLCFAVGIGGMAAAQDDLDALIARLGELYRKGDYAAATKVAEQAVRVAAQAVKVAERQFGRDAVETATPVNDLAEVWKAQGKDADAEPLFKRALAIREKALGPDHPDTAASLDNLAECYRAQERHAEAEPLSRRALAIREKTLGPDHPLTDKSLVNLAWIYHWQKKYAEAEPLYERVLAIREKAYGPDHPDTVKSVNMLAVNYEKQGKYAEAEPLNKRSLVIREKTLGPDHPDVAYSLVSMANLYVSQGKYAEAEPFYKRALALREKAYGPEHYSVAGTLNSLAVLYESQGKNAEAEPLYKRAQAIHEKNHGPDETDTVLAYHFCEQGNLLYTQGKYVEAERFYKRALAMREKAYGPEHTTTAVSLRMLADLYAVQGKYVEAEPLLKRALAILEKAHGPDHPHTALTLGILALLSKSQGKYAEAEPLLKRVLAIREKFLGPDHPYTASSLKSLALLEAALNRFPNAASLFDRSRRDTRRRVARVLPSLSAAEQALFLRAKDEASFHIALSLGLLQKSSPQIALLSASWLANGKAVAQEAASQQIILARQSENPATLAAVVTLSGVRAELAKLAQMTPEPKEAAAYQAKLAELQAEEHKIVHEIGGQLAALDRDEPWVEIEEIRKNLPAGSVLVDIARLYTFDFWAKGQDNPWEPARYAAWIVPPAGKGDVTILDLGPAEEIDAAVAAYREAIDAVQKGGFKRGQDTAEQELTITAAPLTHKVLQPIVDAIGSATEIVLSPDGALWLVPWQAIPLADGSYAIEKFTIRTVTSARDLVPPPEYAKAAAGASGGPVVVADPAFDAAPPATGSSSRPATRAFASAGQRFEPVDRLPATLAEARASAAALGKIFSREPKQFTGTAATEENVKRQAARPPALVLATHGFFREDQVAKRDDSSRLGGSGSSGTRAVTTTGEPIEDPLLRCGLLLAGANLTNAGQTLPGDDGILTGAEIVGLDLLGTDLVVLSACQTGEGKVNVGEGVAGLRQAFQIAGARSVVATLWQVPDLESGLIMQTFYANVAKGLPPSQALREAQLTFIKARRQDRAAGEAAHPYLWAAYGVTGR